MHTPLELIRPTDRLRLPWKNGMGVTGEIASGPTWRASVADLGATMTSFSAFEGRDRIFTVVGDFGVEFEIDGETTRIDPVEPFRFDGARTPRCRPAGPTSAFNIMVDDATTTATVTVHESNGSPLTIDSNPVTVVYVRLGTVTILGTTAGPGDCAVLKNVEADITGHAQILVAEIGPRTDALAQL